MSRWTKRLLVLAILVLVIVVLRLTVFRPAPVPVTVVQVERGRVENTVVNSRAGTVESRQRSRMSPGTSGLVIQIPVEKGASVQKGEVLLRLDDSEHRAQVNLASRSLDAAEASAERACLAAEQADDELLRGHLEAEHAHGNLLLDREILRDVEGEARLSHRGAADDES